MHWMDGFWGGGFMMIFWWTLIIISIVALGKWIFNRGTTPTKEESPLEILKRRYAKGEITKEEFDNLKKDII